MNTWLWSGVEPEALLFSRDLRCCLSDTLLWEPLHTSEEHLRTAQTENSQFTSKYHDDLLRVFVLVTFVTLWPNTWHIQLMGVSFILLIVPEGSVHVIWLCVWASGEKEHHGGRSKWRRRLFPSWQTGSRASHNRKGPGQDLASCRSCPSDPLPQTGPIFHSSTTSWLSIQILNPLLD
jgi:hypothetical protein